MIYQIFVLSRDLFLHSESEYCCEKISQLSSSSTLFLSVDGVNLVIIWSREIPKLMEQMLRLVICCLQVVGIYFLGRLLDLMLNMHQNTWPGKGNAESGCSKQSSSWGSLVVGPGGAPHSLGSKRGRPWSWPAGRLWELRVRNQHRSAQCQTQLLSPACLQIFHQCCSTEVLTYQTS